MGINRDDAQKSVWIVPPSDDLQYTQAITEGNPTHRPVFYDKLDRIANDIYSLNGVEIPDEVVVEQSPRRQKVKMYDIFNRGELNWNVGFMRVSGMMTTEDIVFGKLRRRLLVKGLTVVDREPGLFQVVASYDPQWGANGETDYFDSVRFATELQAALRLDKTIGLQFVGQTRIVSTSHGKVYHANVSEIAGITVPRRLEMEDAPDGHPCKGRPMRPAKLGLWSTDRMNASSAANLEDQILVDATRIQMRPLPLANHDQAAHAPAFAPAQNGIGDDLD